MRLVLLMALAALAVAAWAVQSASAEGVRTYCPRVTSEHNADTTDLARFRNFAPWKEKKGNDLAIAIWQYLCDYETGLYHYGEVVDGQDPFMEYAHQREPLKILNVYNMGYCGIFGPTVEGIFYGCGFETGRSFGVAKWSHCATELYYDNAWHYFDVDVRGIVLKPDGTVASLEECRKNKQLWIDSLDKIKPFFPHSATADKIAKVADIYATSDIDFQYRWFQGSHSVDYSLRPGESFTRWWDDANGRWNHHPNYNKDKFLHDTLLPQKPIGMKPNHREFTKWNHGAGLYHYEPKLTAGSDDFAAGAFSAAGVEPGKDGLVLTADKAQWIVQVQAPFVIVPKVNKMDDLDDDSEAAVVKLAAALPVKVEITLDNGLSWADAGQIEPGKESLDLTKQVKGRYGYMLRFSASGKKGDLVAKSLAVDTWVQVAPISLPRLKKGANKLRYDCGDRYDGITVPMFVLPNVADPEDLKKYVTDMPKRYTPANNLARIEGECIVKVQAPPGAKIVWFSAGGAFNSHQGEAAKNTANTMSYAVGKPEDFKEFYKAKNPDWVQHWRYNWDADVKLDQPAEVVYLRYFGRPAVNQIRAAAHLTPVAKHDPAVKITHGFGADGKLTEKTVEMAAPGDYTVECAGEKIENVFIRIEKASK